MLYAMWYVWHLARLPDILYMVQQSLLCATLNLHFIGGATGQVCAEWAVPCPGECGAQAVPRATRK